MVKILVIDDEAQLRAFLRRVFEAAGYEVAEAENGARGLDVFSRSPADLVVTDILMPEKEGIETILALKQADPRVLVIGISGGGQIHDLDFLDAAFKLGADRVMAKPFRAAEMLKTVAEMLADAR